MQEDDDSTTEELFLTVTNESDEDGNPFADFDDNEWRAYLGAMGPEQIDRYLMEIRPPDHILDEFLGDFL